MLVKKLEKQQSLCGENEKLSCLNILTIMRLLIEAIHEEFQELRLSLEFSREQTDSLTKENHFLKAIRSTQHTHNSTHLRKTMKENTLDLQTRSMTDNLVFTGIREQLMIKQLQLPSETIARSQNNNNRRSSQNSNTIKKKSWFRGKADDLKALGVGSGSNTD